MPQGGNRGQNLGHLKNHFIFAFIFLLCNQSYLKNRYNSGLTLPVTSDSMLFFFVCFFIIRS